MIRMTHKASGAEGQSNDGLEAYKKMIETEKYKKWHNGENARRRIGMSGIVHNQEHLLDRALSIIKRGIEQPWEV